MTTEKQSPKKQTKSTTQTPSVKKTKTPSTKAGTTKKTISEPVSAVDVMVGKQKSDTVDSIKRITDSAKILDEGTKLFEQLHGRLSKQIDRTNTVIEEIRQLCQEKGITVPELNDAIVDSNKMMVFKAKLDRYMREIKSEQTGVDQKVAILGVMVELSDTISTMENKG